ncbi:PAS domain-containing protein [Sphingomonas parva]|nr:PAS domain-containing protein [Sphingomonas parva]
MSSERRVTAGGLRGWGGLGALLKQEFDDPEALLEAVERAADREELLLEALRIAGVGAWEFDPASQTLSWSDETFRIFGLDPGSTVPSNELFYSFVEESDRERMLSRQALSYETGAIFDEEYRIIRADGELRYLNSRAQIVPRGKDRNNRFLGVVRDVTERRIFEQKLEAERAVAQKLQSDLIHISRVSAMDTMSSAMAHELNQPLTSITN